MKPLPCGYDPGVGNDKLAVVTGDGIRDVITTSVVGVGETDLGQLGTGTLGRRRRSGLPDVVSWGDPPVSYLVGRNVERYAPPVQRTDFNLYGGPERRSLFYASVSHVLDGGRHHLAILAGMPVQIVGHRATARETLRALRAWLLGKHTFTVDDTAYEVDVASVDIMAQPVGTFFSWGLDNTGKWVRDKRDLQVPVAICDVGFNTLDLFTVENGEVVGSATGGDTTGMRRAAELIASRIRSQYDVKVSLHRADKMTRERKPEIHTADGTFDVSALIAQALDTAAAGVVTFVDQKWGNARQFPHVLFTGGGAETLRKHLQLKIPHGDIVPNAVTANAVGLARYARRMMSK
jgi:hypothetical protein